MSYLDQRMTPSRIWALVIVALLHVALGFALVYGLYARYTSNKSEDLETFDVEEPPPPEEEPPPPPDTPPPPQSPQIVTPPPIVSQQAPVVQMQTTTNENQPPPTTYVAPPAPPSPPAPVVPPPAPPPPPPASPPTPARLRSGSISDADYPASAIRAEAQGTTRISLQIGADGRVTSCSVTGSSGNSALDSTACSLAQRRFRYAPATRDGQPVASSASFSVRWQLPND